MPWGCLAIADVLDSSGGGSADDAGAYQVLARRARPQTFSEVVGQEHVTRTLVNAISSGRLAHAFVFSGMRGVGKTTTARILAKALNCERGPTPEPCSTCKSCVDIAEGRSIDVLEVDAASQTGIDATRELLETVKYQPASGRYRVYIIDEAHGLSKQAVDAFLKTLEEPPPHAKFILATTAPQKLTTTILSRCQRFDFRAVPGDTIVDTLAVMVKGEGMAADPEALAAIARESGGSLRDATSLLDQVLAFSDGQVDAASVGMALGLPDVAAVRQLFDAIVAHDPAAALEVIGRVVAQGTDLPRFAQDLLQRLRNLTVLAVAGRGALADLTRHEIEDLTQAREGLNPEDLQRWFRILLGGSEEISRSPKPRLVLEMTVLRMAMQTPLVPLDQLVVRLETLERSSRGGPPGSGARAPGDSRAAAPPSPTGVRPPAKTSPDRPTGAPSAPKSRTATKAAPSGPTKAQPAAGLPPVVASASSATSPAVAVASSATSPAVAVASSATSPAVAVASSATSPAVAAASSATSPAVAAASSATSPAVAAASSATSPAVAAASPATSPAVAVASSATSPAVAVASSATSPAVAAAARPDEAAPRSGPLRGAEVSAQVQETWEALVSELQKQQTARFFRLAYSEVVGLEEDRLWVRVTGGKALAELMKPETRRLIEEAATAAYGRPLLFEGVASEGEGTTERAEPVSLERQGREDPVVKWSVEVLDGKVEGVQPLQRREGS